MKLGIQNLTQLLRLIHQQIILPDDYAVGYRSNLAAILCIRTGWTQVRVCPPRASPVSVMACTNHQVSNSAVADMFDVAFLPPSYLTSAMEPLSINCLVSSDGPGQIFTVEIPRNKNVAILKDIIKEKKHIVFVNTEATDIQLFKVSLSMADLEQAQDPRKVNGVQELSPPIAKVSVIFEDLPEDKVHVIVLAPTGERRVLARLSSRLMDLTSTAQASHFVNWYAAQVPSVTHTNDPTQQMTIALRSALVHSKPVRYHVRRPFRLLTEITRRSRTM